MTNAREEQAKSIEREISSLVASIESLKLRISELEAFETAGLEGPILRAVRTLLKPVQIRLRAVTAKSQEEIDDAIHFLIESAEGDPERFFRLFMSPRLASYISGDAKTIREEDLRDSSMELLGSFLDLVERLDNQRQNESLAAALRRSQLQERLRESTSRLTNLQGEVAKLKPLTLSEVPEEKFVLLGKRMGRPGDSRESLATHVENILPDTLSADFRSTQLLATAMKAYEAELLLISQIFATANMLPTESCSGCLMESRECPCSPSERLDKSLNRLLGSDSEQCKNFISKYWLNFYPHFYLPTVSAFSTIRSSIPEWTVNLSPHLLEIFSRLLFGKLLNPFWFQSDIKTARTDSNSRIDLNRWTKSVTRLSIKEIGEILGESIPALSGDEDLPIAWLLAVTNGAHEFSDELEFFLESQIEQAGD